MIPVEPLTAEIRARFAARRGAIEGPVREAVEAILGDFRKDPDGTIRALTRRFDGADLERFEVSDAEVAAAEEAVPEPVKAALRAMHESVLRYHRQDVPRGFEIEPIKGVTLGKLVVPFERAGIYVPGGLAVYPSSVVMAAAPARAAGVRELVLCTPPTADGSVPAPVLYAALLCGVTRVFKVGGAQAIFAMAYGTPTVPRCDILAGPGNAYVTAAKKIVSDEVAIDFLAGPTELLVLSDGEASPRFLAAELAAQAEHAPDACCVLATTSRPQAQETARELEAQAAACERADIIRRAMTSSGALLVAASLDEAVDFSNAFGPEHLTIATRRPAELLPRIRHAGSVFLGEYSPVAAGDYGAGPNAILPTFGEARRRGGLSAATFLKSLTWQRLTKEGLERVGPTAVTLARVENLTAHLRSVEVRLGR